MHYLSFFIDFMLFFKKNGDEDEKTAARCGNGSGGMMKHG